eukprot:CAMPEP_0172208418 /NCGR_PEP_ID=MMETSP1050-20130122/34455_1 /TAXON_ID=233186 /ORGANISM="Cryptomonas curvata, Strain CCAP979/52" /LENGTH=33 /DNA_ID= /DNA_START= /DNA_END= /DNA_ORIENTATION=
MKGRNLNETQRISRLDQLFSCRLVGSAAVGDGG